MLETSKNLFNTGDSHSACAYAFLERTRCPACDAISPVHILSAPFSGPEMQRAMLRKAARELRESTALYQLDQCRVCRLIFQRFVGGEALLADLYGKWLSTSWHRDLGERTAHAVLSAPLLSREAQELLCISAWFGKPPCSLRTLDYGMGWGLWARVARFLGFQSYGFDLAEERMKAAEEAGVRVIQESSLETGFFDFINTDQVFEHLSHPLALAKSLHKVLRPGGILKVCVPNGEHVHMELSQIDWQSGERALPSPVAPLEHVNCFTNRSLHALADASGFKVVRPSWRNQFNFLRYRGTIDLRRPALAAKAIIRPWYRYHNSLEMYVWLQKP